MKLFTQGNDFEVWRIIDEGPSNLIKKMNQWDSNDLEILELNAKAMHILFTALKEEAYNKVSMCNSAMKIWERLECMYGEKELEKGKCEKENSTSGEESSKIQFLTQGCEASSSSYKPCSSLNHEGNVKFLFNNAFTYTFEEFEEAFNEMVHKYEKINLENEEIISNPNIENNFLTNAKLELENENKKLKMKFKLCLKDLNDIEKENEKLINTFENYKKKIH